MRVIKGFALMALLSWIPVVSGSDYTLLDDCENKTKWSAVAGELLASTDAAGGKGAIGIKVGMPSDAELVFDLKSTGLNLSEYDLIAFDYKLSGPVDYVDFIIRQYPLNGGRRGNFYPIDEADTRDAWATKILPLRGPENLSIYLSAFSTDTTELKFQFKSKPGMEPVTLLVDNLRVIKNRMDIRPITFGKWFRAENGDVIWQYSIPIKNASDVPLEANITIDCGKMKNFRAGMIPSRIFIPSSSTVSINAEIIIPSSVATSHPAYYGESMTVNIADKMISLPTRLVAAVPPTTFAHPSLLGSLEQIKSIPQRIVGNPQLERAWKDIIKLADDAVAEKTAVPDFNGGGSTKCGVDNTELQPIERRGLNRKVYICPKCGRVYQGKLLDSAFSGAGGWKGTHMKLSEELLACALAYRVTDEAKYGLRAAEIIRGYTEKYLTYDMMFTQDNFYPAGPESPSSRRICGWHFMENRWIQHAAIAYDMLVGTGVLSEAEWAAFEQKALLPAVQKTTENEVGLNNIQFPHSLAQICAGFALNDPMMVYYGSYGERGIIRALDHRMLDDGTWSESPNYNAYMAGLLPQCLYLLKRVGCDPYSEKVIKFFYKPTLMANPDGNLPGFGDGPACPSAQWGTHALLPYYDTKDPRLADVIRQYVAQPMRGLNQYFMLMAYDKAAKPDAGRKEISRRECVDFSGLGFVFLNNNANDLWFAMIYGGHIGHGHYDRMSFELYGGGAIQAIDDGAGPYNQYHDEFNVSTLAHNTVVVDMTNQKPGVGKLIDWQVSDEIKIATAASSQLYDGVNFRRTAVMFPDAVLLIDHIESDQPRTFDWVYHNKGKIVVAPKMNPVQPLAGQGAYSYLKDLKKSDEDASNVKIEFRQRGIKGEKEGSGLALTRYSGNGVTLYNAVTGHGHKNIYQCDTLLFRSKGVGIDCVTLLEPLKPGATPVYSMNRNGDAVTVSCDKRKWSLSSSDIKIKVIEEK